MKSIATCFLALLTVVPMYAQDRQPNIDMPLHAYQGGHFWLAGAPKPATGYPLDLI